MELRNLSLEDLDAVMQLESGTFPSDAWSKESMVSELASPAG